MLTKLKQNPILLLNNKQLISQIPNFEILKINSITNK